MRLGPKRDLQWEDKLGDLKIRGTGLGLLQYIIMGYTVMKRIWKESETSESGETGWLILAKAGEVEKKS